MKKLITTISACAIAAVLAGFIPLTAQAGPGVQQLYVPVKTQQQAESLKPGTKVAVTCPMCGAVTISKVDKAKTQAHSFDCAVCKHSFQIVPAGGGKATAGKFICRDTKTGKTMPLSMCAEMH